MNKAKKVKAKNKPVIGVVSKQIVSKYVSPVPVKFSNGEDMFAMRENSSKPLIIKNEKDV